VVVTGTPLGDPLLDDALYRGDLPARAVKPRAKELADGAWAARAVRDAVVAAQAAITAAVTASVAATASGSS
jgi:hypothetical protein